MEATDALRDYAEEKVRHAERLVRDAIDAHVVLSVTKRRHFAEITLQADHGTFNATEETGDLYSAIDHAVAKLEKQLRKLRTKRESRKHSHAVESVSTAPPTSKRQRIETNQVAAEPLSVSEAVAIMEGENRDAIVFREPGTELLRFMYRKKSGGLAILEPEGI